MIISPHQMQLIKEKRIHNTTQRNTI